MIRNGTTGDCEFTLDMATVRRAFGRAAATYDSVAVLQAEVRGRLLERLDLVRIDPRVIVDAGAGTGHGSRELQRRYRHSRVLALDIAEGMLREARRQQRPLRRFRRVCAETARLPIRDHCVDLIFSNLMLHWCNDLDAVFHEYRRVLRPGGLLTFTTFGPDTLIELRRAWSAADPYTHVNRFVDMHDLGDALVRSGLAEPVMDVERYTLTYDGVTGLMRDLRSMGAGNANAGRNRALTGRRALARMIDVYDQMRSEGRIPATHEVVYGQAWAPAEPTSRRNPVTETRIPIGRIGRIDRPGPRETAAHER
jgi:malonyl-CoA O-methyltransferase